MPKHTLLLIVCLLMVGVWLASASSVLAAPPIPPPASTASTSVYYRVQWGDVLSRIAVRYGTSVSALVQANGLRDPDCIYAGQLLRIPSGASQPVTVVHVVRWGETLTGIARRYGTTARAIGQLNNIWDLNCIYAGQRLLIPDP